MLLEVDSTIVEKTHTFRLEPRSMRLMSGGKFAASLDHAMRRDARPAFGRCGHRPAHLARFARVAQ